jgi:hypothetical protein
MKTLSLSLILFLFSSGRQMKMEMKGDGECRPTGRDLALSRPEQPRIQSFLAQNGQILASWLGYGPFPTGRDLVISRPDLGRLVEIRPFPGQILADWPGSSLSQARTTRIRPLTGGRKWEGEGRWREEAEMR